MKILELSPSLASGGAERFTVDLANELSKTDDVTLLVMREFKDSDFYKKELSSSVRCIECHGKTSLYSKILQVFIALYWIVRLKPDVVHTHTVAFNWIIIPSIFLHKIKFYFTVHNLAEQECTTKIGFKLRKWLFESKIRAIAISSICADSFKHLYGYSCFETINNGCRNISVTNKLDDVNKEIDLYRRNPDTKIFINVARIMPQKNHKLLIESFNNFISKGYDAVLLIVGDYNRIENLKDDLDRLIKTDRILFLGTRLNVGDYLSCSDYFCLSSLWEGLPISLLEAGLSGCYPISTPAGGVLDVIKDRFWGILSKDFTVEAYTEALEMSLRTKINKFELADKYHALFSMSVCAKNYIKVFNRNC